jgi:GDSL-like Lipase/Acylhydrolase family
MGETSRREKARLRHGVCSCILSALLFAVAISVAVPWACAQDTSFSTEEIEWTWEVRPAHPNAALPNVLLIGDSITRNYFPEVARRLGEKANVYLLATSACVGDSRLPHQITDFSTMEAVRFDLVHFNNGMHGWFYTETQYKEAFPAFLQAIQSAAPDAQLVWATTTPVRADATTGATNPRIDARNAIAKSFIEGQGIVTDDQHKLMMHHLDTYQDSVHFNKYGAEEQAAQVASVITGATAGRHYQHASPSGHLVM